MQCGGKGKRVMLVEGRGEVGHVGKVVKCKGWGVQRRGAESSGTKGVAVSNRGLVQVKEIMIKV